MMLKIYPVLCRQGTMDNYAYILQDEKASAIVDAPETAPIVNKCRELDIKPNFLLNTHHHFDHTDSNLELKRFFGLKIVGAEKDKNRIAGLDMGVNEGDIFKLGQSSAEIIDTSAHTQGHILWHFAQDNALFTGDTLFNLSIGGLFEGTPQQMWLALQKIKNLPDNTVFYPGHEYTLLSINVLQSHPKLPEYLAYKQQKGFVTLGLEKQINPYLTAADFAEFIKLFD